MSKYEFKTEPWVHQRDVLTKTWDKKYAAWLMEYGTGKTWVAINNAGILFEQGLIDALFIIAPNGVHLQWIDEQLPMHLPDRIPTVIRAWENKNSLKFKRSLEDFWLDRNENKLKIVSMNVEALQSDGKARNFSTNFLDSFLTFLVIDESTRIKNHSAARTKFIMNKLSPLATYRRTLTGNEVTRSPFDVYCPYRFLNNNFWKPIRSYHVFTHRYGEFKNQFAYKKFVKVAGFVCPSCSGIPDQLNFKRLSEQIFTTCDLCNKVIKEDHLPDKVLNLLEDGGRQKFPQLIKYKNLDELRKRTAKCSIIVRKEDCMDLPKKIYQPLYCEMNSDQMKLYHDLKKTMRMEYEGVEVEVKVKIALSIRFQQIVGGFYPESMEPIGTKNPKIETMLYSLEDIDTGDPIIVWARFISEIEALTNRLRKEYDGITESYYGATSRDDRSKIMENFKAGKIRFLVANQATAGTGLNLQRSYIHYYFSNSFNAEDRWQSEDRSHRGGQTRNCLYKDLLIKGTIDDTLHQSNREKKNFAEYFKEKEFFDII